MLMNRLSSLKRRPHLAFASIQKSKILLVILLVVVVISVVFSPLGLHNSHSSDNKFRKLQSKESISVHLDPIPIHTYEVLQDSAVPSSICPQLPQFDGDAFGGQEKYLFYSRSMDWCTGIRHYRWSLSCALGEAVYLGRTFVLDLDICLHKEHHKLKGEDDNVVRDFRMYFDLDNLMKHMKVVIRSQFLVKWGEWNADKPWVSIADVDRYALTTDLAKDNVSTIMRRSFLKTEEYFYQVCKNNPVIERPWKAFWGYSPPLMDMVFQILEKLHWDFDAVHVRRGDKINAFRPNLDRDTQPDSLLKKLPKFIAPGRRIYIATDEDAPGFFDLLKTKYTVFLLEEFSWMWAEGSAWHNYATCIYGADSNKLAFDGYMRAIIDYSLFERASVKVETFNDLTDDQRHGGHCLDCDR